MTGPHKKPVRAVVATLLLRVLALLPLRLAHSLGGWLGWGLSVAPNRIQRIAGANIDACFPERTQQERRRILRDSLMESGKALLETGAMWLWESDRLLPLVRKVDGEDGVRRALEQGRGAIFLTPHLGCWEIAGLYAAARYPMTILYRSPRLTGLDNLMRQARARSGARLVTTDTAGVRALLRTLREGAVLGILPDQEPPKDAGVFAPFFGLPAFTMVLVSRLVLRTRSPVFIAYCKRLEKGRGYHLHFERIPDQPLQDSVEASVTAINEAVEHCVRVLPTQYQWGYKRFRRRPPGSASLYQSANTPAGKSVQRK